MTRKLLLTTAIVALALAPSIGTGTVQARGFYGGGFGGGFHGGFGGASSSQTLAGKIRRFAPDSPLEGTGFEPSVPRSRPASSCCRFSFAPTFR
jgi:hypothetical protein